MYSVKSNLKKIIRNLGEVLLIFLPIRRRQIRSIPVSSKPVQPCWLFYIWISRTVIFNRETVSNISEAKKKMNGQERNRNGRNITE